jgi:hypothetical protein
MLPSSGRLTVPETDDWAGKKVILYTAKVSYQGQMVDGLRIEIPQDFAATDADIPF